MTSLRQVAANRMNASKSTGPRTEAGKDRSRRNAVRHGLTAETVIEPLEDAEDYGRFEAAVTADFNPETAVERELVLRLASLLWRLRRAASIETGLFKNSAKVIAESNRATEPARETFAPVKSFMSQREQGPTSSGSIEHQTQLAHTSNDLDRVEKRPEGDADIISNLAGSFLRLAAMDKGAFERLGRYETALWRQVCQTALMLELLRRQGFDMKWHPRSSHRGSSNIFSLPVFLRR